MFFGQPRAIGNWKILLLGLPFQNLFMNIFSYLSRKKGGGGGGGGGGAGLLCVLLGIGRSTRDHCGRV